MGQLKRAAKVCFQIGSISFLFLVDQHWTSPNEALAHCAPSGPPRVKGRKPRRERMFSGLAPIADLRPRRRQPRKGNVSAMANGVQMGRPSKLSTHQRRDAMNVLNDGTASRADMALRFNVSQATISRFAPERLLLAFQPLIAFTIVSATLLYPLKATIAVAGLVCAILIEASVHPCLAEGLARIFRRNR